MIPVINSAWESDDDQDWSLALRQAFRSSKDLLAALGTDHPNVSESDNFPILVPRRFAQRIIPGDPQDPILLQVLGTQAEQHNTPGFSIDPLMEHGLNTSDQHSSLIQKYQGRVLLITTAGCAVHCRYCFRRHFPYSSHQDRQYEQAIQQIQQDSSISEVILSGGDPLILTDQALHGLLSKVRNIPHIKRIRIHSRVPVVLPQRITDELVNLLWDETMPTTLVVHVNHPQELDTQTANVFGKLKDRGIWLLNQAVIFKKINDSVEVQVALAEKLFNQGVLPYYLHLPDRVANTGHFYIDRESAVNIYHKMQAQLPGYLLPKLVEELPGASSKTQVHQ